MTAPRNQVAKLRRLYDAGVLTLPMLREVEITHEPGCPASDPRTLDCVCDPVISIALLKVPAGRLLYEIGVSS